MDPGTDDRAVRLVGTRQYLTALSDHYGRIVSRPSPAIGRYSGLRDDEVREPRFDRRADGRGRTECSPSLSDADPYMAIRKRPIGRRRDRYSIDSRLNQAALAPQFKALLDEPVRMAVDLPGPSSRLCALPADHRTRLNSPNALSAPGASTSRLLLSGRCSTHSFAR
jgi:hypothetical protein